MLFIHFSYLIFIITMTDKDNYSYFINEEVSMKRLTYSWEECNVISRIFFLPVISTLILQTQSVFIIIQ